MELLRSLLFTAYVLISAPLYSIVVIASGLLPLPTRFRVVRYWADSVLWMGRVLCGLEYRIEGAENITGNRGVALWKHSSAWETIAQFCVFPPQCCVLKRELMWLPLVGWALKVLKPIAIDRQAGRSAVQQVLEQGKARLDEGLWVIVFPEGTRVTAGESRKYGVSGALLAMEADCPLLPVAHNAGEFWPRRGLRKRAGLIRVIIGRPIPTAGRTVREVNAEARDWIEARISEIRDGTGQAASVPATTSDVEVGHR